MNMMLYLDGLWLCELCDAILISRIMIARNGWNEINEAVLRSEWYTYQYWMQVNAVHVIPLDFIQVV